MVYFVRQRRGRKRMTIHNQRSFLAGEFLFGQGGERLVVGKIVTGQHFVNMALGQCFQRGAAGGVFIANPHAFCAHGLVFRIIKPFCITGDDGKDEFQAG